MQPASTFTLLGFAAVAASSPTAPAVSELQPFEVYNLNVNRTAGNDRANIHFYVTDLNTNDTTVCNDDKVAPDEIHFCNGVPQYSFAEDFKKLSISWLWLEGFQSHTVASGTANLNWTCLELPIAQGVQQCFTEMFNVPITISN